ncbi:hypothetical protein RDV89_09780 [Nocardioides zeae]|uniref:Uncharacterized protein n=1 Tax=Nocardioides imazamoxiresistens TaxID=3231893 RepID=A0ABU3PVX1_9ACTN|nr:hypothetical protein [Nocardioides zeae]MDT9593356.1 hypothetical protein [Nocardioides zeae]
MHHHPETTAALARLRDAELRQQWTARPRRRTLPGDDDGPPRPRRRRRG